jgi:hypothetical protein
VDIVYGYCIWILYMDIVYGYCMYIMFMYIVYYVFMWCIVHGVGLAGWKI